MLIYLNWVEEFSKRSELDPLNHKMSRMILLQDQYSNEKKNIVRPLFWP